MSTLNYRSLLTSAFVLASSAHLAAAQDAEDEERRLDNVEVSGQVLYSDQINALKTPTPIIDVPQSLSIITADQIAEQGFNSVADIITYTPGVSTSQGEGHRDAVVFRGIRSTADFFVDGVRDDVQYYRSLYNLEQVEILRGPNALLFGRGGTGGIVNRVTKKGTIGENFTGYSASVDTFEEFSASIDHNVTTGENAAFRVNAIYENLSNHREFYDGDQFSINPTLHFAFGDSTTLDLSYEYIDHDRFIDRGIPTGSDGEPVEAFTDIVFGDASLNTTEFKAHIMRANLQHEFSEYLKGNFTAAYGDYDKLYQNFYASGYNQAATPDRVTLDGYVDTTQRERFTLAGNLVGEFSTGNIGHTLIVGAEYLDTSNDNDRDNARWSSNGFTDDNDTFIITRPLGLTGGTGINADGIVTTNDFSLNRNDATEADIEVASLFIQDQIEINQYLEVLLGARFDSFDIAVDDIENGVSRSRKDEEISPRAGLIFKPKENISLYASYSESFLPRSGGQYASLSSSTERLAPDVFEQAEIGVKWDFAQGLSLTAAYFQNEQTRTARDQNDETFETRGIEVDGFELQLQGYLTDQLSVIAGYSYLDGETASGSATPRELPENMFSIWGNYDITDKFGIGLGATYQDESFITDFEIGVDSEATHPTLPAYTRFDAAAYYDVSDTLRLQLNIENLTDETYFPNAHATHQASVGAPLNARFTISGRF